MGDSSKYDAHCHQELIRENLPYLCNHSTEIPIVLVHLVSEGVLLKSTQEKILKEPSTFEQFAMMYNTVSKKLSKPENYVKLKESLIAAGNETIVEYLEEKKEKGGK